MLKRTLMLLTTLFALLTMALWVSLPVTLAIGEVTPTPLPGLAPVDPTPTPMPLSPATDATPVPLSPVTDPTPVPLSPATETGTGLPEFSADVLALMDRAIEELQAGDFEAVIDTMDEALALEGRNPDAYVLRGAAHEQLGDFTRAIDDYTRAINLIPYSAQYYLFRGNAYVGLNETGEAMLDYNRAAELDPRFEDVFVTRSLLNNALGKTKEAEIDNLIAQGLASVAGQDYRGAIRNFDDALAADTGKTRSSAYAYYNRGLANFILQDYNTSIRDYTSALELYPDMHDSYLGRGIAHSFNGDVRRAGSDYLRRIEILEASTVEQTLEIGQSTDVMMAYGNVYRITFEGRGGDTVSVEARATSDSSVDALLVLVDPSGAAIAGDDDTGAGINDLDSLVENVRLPADGTYTIVVSHANGGFDGMIRVKVSQN